MEGFLAVLLIVVFLFAISKSKKKKKASKQKSVVPKPRKIEPQKTLDCLDEDGNLPFGWMTYHQDIVTAIQAEDAKSIESIQHGVEPKKEYEILKKYFAQVEERKRKYYAMGACVGKYYEEYVCSSAGMDWLTREYADLKINLDKRQKEYERMHYIREQLLPELREKLYVIIKENPGILQTDAYKHFAADMKGYVQTELHNMEYEGLIIREKSGRSYSLRMK